MNIRIEALEDKESTLWNRFVENHPQATPFHSWEYGEILSATYGCKRYYLAARCGEKVSGVFPLILIESSFLGRKLLSLPFCEYGGPLIDPTDSAVPSIAIAFLNEIRILAECLNVDYVEIRDPSLTGKIFKSNNYESANRYINFIIRLSADENDLWASLDQGARNRTRKAIKNNISVRQVKRDEELKEYFSLYLMTQKQHGSPPHSYELFANILKKMKRNIKVLAGMYHNIAIAGMTVFHNKHNIYWWNGVSNPEFKSLNAMSLLLWNVIQWGNRSGRLFLSLGRTRISDSVYRFKKDWGGEETHLTDYAYRLRGSKTMTPDPSEGKYRLLTKLWSRLPIPMTKLLGPAIIKQVGL